MEIVMKPIGHVKNSRTEIADDNWSEIVSEIKLNKDIASNSIEGIENFSHLEIIFYMNKVSDEKAVVQCRHPRNDKSLPQVGTFSQRNKNRPNKIGLTTVEFVRKSGNSIFVKNLDAIDQTPVLDIKPVMQEFLPLTEVKQPEWSKKIMKNYWQK
jgi:tRNA (adenine37-N6)-methyltransferase